MGNIRGVLQKWQQQRTRSTPLLLLRGEKSCGVALFSLTSPTYSLLFVLLLPSGLVLRRCRIRCHVLHMGLLDFLLGFELFVHDAFLVYDAGALVLFFFSSMVSSRTIMFVERRARVALL